MNTRMMFARAVAGAAKETGERRIVIIAVPLLCIALLVMMLCTNGCAWLNGNRGGLSADCHEITLSNTFMTIDNTEYSFAKDNMPFAFMLKRSNTWYEFDFRLSNDSALRVEIAGVEFAFTNHVVTMRGVDVAGIQKIENFNDGMEFCEGWVRFGIGNRRGYPPSFIFNAASPSSGSSAFLRYSLPDTQETSGPVPFRILECAGVKVRHLSNWYEW